MIRVTPGLSICFRVIMLTLGLSICLSEMQQKDQEREALDRKVKELGEKRERQEREQAERRKQSFSRSGEHIYQSVSLPVSLFVCLPVSPVFVCAPTSRHMLMCLCA